MRRILLGFFVISGFLMLSGCAGMYQTVNDASNKHDGSLINPPADTATPKCDQWCHNGWCSSHCQT